MAAWYVGSTKYTAVTQWTASHAYTVGAIVRQLATPTVGNERCFRCTTAGTSGATEPTWNLTKSATTSSGTATFTEVTGNSTYNWNAPHALIGNAAAWSGAGDDIYVSHNHAASIAATGGINPPNGTQTSPNRVLCVNDAGSVPPVSADLRTTASETTTGANLMYSGGYVYIYGITLNCGTGSGFSAHYINNSGGWLRLDSCSLNIGVTNAAADASTIFGCVGQYKPSGAELINTTVSFGNSSQGLGFASGHFFWKNTLGAVTGATLPNNLLVSIGDESMAAVVRLDEVDLSALGSGQTINGLVHTPNVVQITNCKLGASVTVCGTIDTQGGGHCDLINSDSTATGYRQERYRFQGTLTTETTTILAANDGVAGISWKVVTTADSKWYSPFETFQIAQWNATTGSLKTATVEITSASTLTNADVWVEVEYLGSSAQPISSFVTSGTADVLASGSTLTTSTAAWSSAKTNKYKMSVSFTPQMAGFIRAVIRVAKASATLYVDPKLTIV